MQQKCFIGNGQAQSVRNSSHTRLLTDAPGHALPPVLRVLPGVPVAPQCRSERGPDRHRLLAGGPLEEVRGSAAAAAGEAPCLGVSPPGRRPPLPPDSRLFGSLRMHIPFDEPLEHLHLPFLPGQAHEHARISKHKPEAWQGLKLQQPTVQARVVSGRCVKGLVGQRCPWASYRPAFNKFRIRAL